jgi:dipeptidase D
MNTARLEPKSVWDIFYEICGIPHCSGKEDGIRKFVRTWAEKRNISFEEDAGGNIVLRSTGAAGSGDRPGLALQAHMDMVCVKDDDAAGDPAAGSIEYGIHDGWVQAKGTSLGADNGIGIAVAMALLEQEGKDYGPLEVLLTTEEEIGLKGALKIKKGFFTSPFLLNLDSEELGHVTIGTAGGEFTDYTLELPHIDPGTSLPFSLQIRGLKSGHSGLEIHLPRLNALKAAAEGLGRAAARCSLMIASVDGGSASNVIPASCGVVFTVEPAEKAAAAEILEEWRKSVLNEWGPAEERMQIEITEMSGSDIDSVFSPHDSKRIIGIMNTVPHGVLAYSNDIPDLVETSNNFATVKTEGNVISFVNMSRSSDMTALEELSGRLSEIGRSFGAAVDRHDRVPGWTADPDSAFNRLVKQEYERTLGHEVRLEAFHAGIECGVFSALEPNLQMASVGPTIKDAHTSSERVETGSVARIWELVRAVYRNMDRL